jgi:hypothetical protein
MANDCYNYLEAPDGDLSLIADYISTRKVEWSKLPDTFLDFEKILPVPAKTKKYIDWTDKNWGCRGNSYDGHAQDEGISFNTPWSPPVGVIVALAKRIGKSLRLIYDEPGMDFCGEFIVDADGRGYTDHVYSPRSDAPDQLKEDLMIDEEGELDNA